MSHTVPPVITLMPLLGFNQQDLNANEQGTLGIMQRQRLARLRQRALAVGGAVFCLLVLLATIFLYIGQTSQTGVLTLLGILITCLNAVALGMFARHWMRLNADLRANQIERLQGTLERVVRPSGRISNYVLRLNGRDFEVTKEAFKQFRHETPYTFYCAPRSGVLLAAQPHDA